MGLMIHKDDLEIKNAGDYIARLLSTDDDDRVCEFMEKHEAQANLIGKIVAADVAYYALRRCAGQGYCGSNCDTMITIRRDYIKQYEKKFGEWIDYNKDVDY